MPLRTPVRPVLVVDADDEVRKMICRTLESEGYYALYAVDAEHALYILDRALDAPCMTLLALCLPGMSAFEFAARQRSDPRFMHVPIVVMTDAKEKPAEAEAILRDAVRLTKPLDPPMLLRVVAMHCEAKAH